MACEQAICLDKRRQILFVFFDVGGATEGCRTLRLSHQQHTACFLDAFHQRSSRFLKVFYYFLVGLDNCTVLQLLLFRHRVELLVIGRGVFQFLRFRFFSAGRFLWFFFGLLHFFLLLRRRFQLLVISRRVLLLLCSPAR